MNMVYVIAAILALIGVLLIAGFVKHVRESAANARRIEREISEHRERLNRESAVTMYLHSYDSSSSSSCGGGGE